jgi:hypothetical protein
MVYWYIIPEYSVPVYPGAPKPLDASPRSHTLSNWAPGVPFDGTGLSLHTVVRNIVLFQSYKASRFVQGRKLAKWGKVEIVLFSKWVALLNQRLLGAPLEN